MGYKIKLNGRITSFDAELPETQGELEYQLREHYPGCYIDSNNWPRYIDVSNDERALEVILRPSGRGTSALRLYATINKGSTWRPGATPERDIQLWRAHNNYAIENSPLAPAFHLLKGDESHLPTLRTAAIARVKVTLQNGSEMTVPIIDCMDGSELIAAVAARCRMNPKDVLLAPCKDGPVMGKVRVGATLSEQGILPGKEFWQKRIDRRSREYQVFNISIKNLLGQTAIIQVDPFTTVKEVKLKYDAQLDTPPDMQRLIYAGKQLEDNCDMMDYNITDGSTVHLVLRLGPGGGMFQMTSGREDFQDLDAVNRIKSKGGIPLEVVLSDSSVLLLEVSKRENVKNIKARIAAMLREREAEKAAKELAAVDLDSIHDVATLQAMLRRVQKRVRELEDPSPTQKTETKEGSKKRTKVRIGRTLYKLK